MTNLEGRVLFRRAAREPPRGVKTDLEVMKLVASALGRGDFISENPADAFAELRRASAGGKADYAGISYERVVRDEGVFWPCPTEAGPDSPRLFAERFATPDGRARFYAVQYRSPAEEPDDDFPFYLTTGRVMAQYQSGNQTRRIRSLAQTEPEAFVEIHPSTAQGIGVANGEMVEVVTRRGRARCKARLVTTIRFDTLFMPFHFPGKGRANSLTNDAVDPVSKIPEFKIAAARLERLTHDQTGPARETMAKPESEADKPHPFIRAKC